MRFSDSSSTPLFQQVADQISDLILTGAIGEGEQVPSTTRISTAYRLNPATVLKGMNILADQGLLAKKRGQGMFVAEGARQRLRAQRAKGTLTRLATQLADQARLLGLSRDDLVTLVKGAYDDHD